MRPGKLLIDLDPQSGTIRRNDEPPVDRNTVFDQRIVKIRLNRFRDQNVWNRGGKLNIRRPFHRSGIKMRRHLGVVGLGQCGDLFRLPDAAGSPECGLQNICGARAQHRAELRLGGQPLASGDGDRCGTCDLCH